MIKIVDNDERFAALRADWKMLETDASLRMFQTFDWCWFAWAHYLKGTSGNRLWILVWQIEGHPEKVIFPFFIDGKGVLRFIMDTHSDMLDVVCKRGFNYHVAFKEAAETILSNPQIKSVWLQKLDGTSQAANGFGVHLRGAMTYRDNAYSWLSVPQTDDFIGSLAHMRSKDRADLRAILRKASHYDMRIVSRDNGDSFPEDDIRRLRAAMQINLGRKNDFLPENLIAFSRSVYESGIADVVELREDGELVALNFLLQKGTRSLSWLFLYTDAKSSTSMYALLLRDLAKAHSCVLDFGVGVYSYKIGTFRPETAVTYSLRLGMSAWRQFGCLCACNLRLLKDYLKVLLRR